MAIQRRKRVVQETVRGWKTMLRLIQESSNAGIVFSVGDVLGKSFQFSDIGSFNVFLA